MASISDIPKDEDNTEWVTKNTSRKLGLLGGQDFFKIREECLREKNLFEDPDFPAEASSLFASSGVGGKIEMRRPCDICKDPQFVVADATRFDVVQGQLADCWYMASVASLTLNKKMFSTVVPEDNTFEEGKYCGAFHFRFWKNGERLDIVIDDRLPTQGNELIYMRSKQDNEFWGALLQKAFAKLHGGYRNLEYGWSHEAFTHLVGGINELYVTSACPPNMFEILTRAAKHDIFQFRHQSFLSCATREMAEAVEKSIGLVGRHMYSITKICVIPQCGTRMLRIRNPHGQTEWTGRWSDESKEGKTIGEDLREKSGLTIDNDGEFWMSFDDALEHFETLEICHWTADDLDEDGDCGVDGRSQKWQSLLQKTPRKNASQYIPIGFRVYSLPKPETQKKPLPAHFFLFHEPVAEKPAFDHLLQVCQRFSLDPGTYVIVPCTETPNTEGEFLLRIFTESKVEMKENEEKISLLNVETSTVHNAERKYIEDFFWKRMEESKQIDWIGLKTVLESAMKQAYQFEGTFPKDVCRSLVGLRDVSKQGKLRFDDVVHLCKIVSTWTMAFKSYDHDNSGHLNGYELREVFASMGFGVDKKMPQTIAVRHGDENGNITFDEFIKCALKLKTIWDAMFYPNGNAKIESRVADTESNVDEWYYSILYL